MKSVLFLCSVALFLSIPAKGQETVVAERFQFHTPAEWKGEVISLPPGFAKDLKWNGTESIRFAPGMFDPTSESFFSYVLVFLIGKEDDVSEAAVKEQVLTYYRGLAAAVMGAGKDITDKFKWSMKAAEEGAVKSPPADAAGKDVKVWTGTLEWVEPFRTRAAQTLNFEIHLWENGGQPVLYFTVSPQKSDHAIWEEMRTYRAAFELK